MAGLELLHDKGFQQGATFHVRCLDQLPVFGPVCGRSRGRRNLVHTPHPDAHGGVDLDLDAARRVLEEGREDGVFVEAEGGHDGDAVVDFVRGDVAAAAAACVVLVPRRRRGGGEERIVEVGVVDGRKVTKGLEVGVGSDQGLVGVQGPDDEVRGEGGREGEVEGEGEGCCWHGDNGLK